MTTTTHHALVPNPARAVLLGVTASTAYAISYLLVRLLGQGRLHSFELAFFRTALCLLVILAISHSLRKRAFTTHRLGTMVARGALSAAGLLLWFYGLVHLPLAESLALSQTTVCFAAIAAAVFLGESITMAKAAAISLAIAGALVIVRPGFGSFHLEYLAVLGAAACWGAAACLVRSAARTEHPFTIVLWTTLLITVFSFPVAVTVWQWPSPLEFLMLAAIGCLTAAGMVAWTTAFKYGEASQVTVTDCVQIAWGVLFGLLAGEVPTGWSLLGIGLICCSVVISSTETTRRAMDSRPTDRCD